MQVNRKLGDHQSELTCVVIIDDNIKASTDNRVRMLMARTTGSKKRKKKEEIETEDFVTVGRPRQFDLPEAVHKKMQENTWTIIDLATATGIPAATLYHNLKGRHPMKIDVALAILEALEFDMDNEAIQIISEMNDNFFKNNKNFQKYYSSNSKKSK